MGLILGHKKEKLTNKDKEYNVTGDGLSFMIFIYGLQYYIKSK